MKRYEGLRELALFAGIGGGILGGKLLGWQCVCAVEIDEFCRKVLRQRQLDGLLREFPVEHDVCTFDGRKWRGKVDVISGGFPCQDISAAGRGAGIEGARSGLWGEFARIIREVGPRYVFVENSPLLTRRGLWRVLGDLASLGYDAVWGVLSAAECGAPHRRERIWIVGEIPYADAERRLAGAHEAVGPCGRMGQSESGADTQLLCGEVSDEGALLHASGERREQNAIQAREPREGVGEGQEGESCGAGCGTGDGASEGGRRYGSDWWSTESGIQRMVDGVADRVDRLKAVGNAQVPLVAATAFVRLADALRERWDIRNSGVLQIE